MSRPSLNLIQRLVGREPDREKRQLLRDAAVASLLRDGEPSEDRRSEFFDLYKMMVTSSEALVSRRQGVNTFFLTINGALLTAIGLFLKGGGSARLQAAGILILALAGFFMCLAWRSLLISFGQLNTGKFTIINTMERHLVAPIYDAEWKALGEGDDPEVYRSFTKREVTIPIVVGAVYTIVSFLSASVALGLWNPGK